jgi:hypothetical protein
MKTLTLRGIKPDLAEQLRRRASREGKSVNRFIVDVVENSVYGDTSGKPREYHDLDHLFGSLTGEDARFIDEAVAKSRSIDEEVWS